MHVTPRGRPLPRGVFAFSRSPRSDEGSQGRVVRPTSVRRLCHGASGPYKIAGWLAAITGLGGEMRILESSILAICAGVLAFFPQGVVAQTVATSFDLPVPAKCRFSQSARVIKSLRDLPAAAEEFRRQNLPIADVGEKFIPFDVEDDSSRGLPHDQFVRAYEFKDRTIVWYFKGGFVRNFHIVELRPREGNGKGAPSRLRLTGVALEGPPCAATEAILAGVRGQQNW